MGERLYDVTCAEVVTEVIYDVYGKADSVGIENNKIYSGGITAISEAEDIIHNAEYELGRLEGTSRNE